LPGFSAAISYGLAAPAGTPRAIVDRLNRELVTALGADPRARLASEGATPLPGTPEDYGTMIYREEMRWGAVVRQLNLKVE
jgi:tripartite-type tricarboxylate transporter receptor subunit TctC